MRTETPTRCTVLMAALAGALVIFAPGDAHAESPDDLVIIAHRNVKATSVSAAELRSYFLRKRENWPSGERVVPVNASEDTALRRAFRQKVLGMTKSEEDEYWQNEGIRRGLQKPGEFSNTLRACFHLKGSVSYVFRRDLKRGVVKVLAVF